MATKHELKESSSFSKGHFPLYLTNPRTIMGGKSHGNKFLELGLFGHELAQIEFPKGAGVP